MPESHEILIVEDEPDLLRFAEVALQLDGYAVRVATDGEQAMMLVREHRPDAVVLDLRLPLADGWQVLSFLQSGAVQPAVPVVVLTATAGPRERERALAAGVADYLVKPVSADRLLDAVAGALGIPRPAPPDAPS
ncbi:MAG TPA: response regulator [Chloroflexota bacterium]|jgi:DNA-binding response OmpR family regulator